MEQQQVSRAFATASPVDLSDVAGLEASARAGGYRTPMRPLQMAAKRVVDVVGTLVLLALCAPLFLVIAAMVGMDGGPVVYRHRRVGLNGQMFDCLKFRTMILGAEECLAEFLSYHPEARREWAADQKLSFDPRVTGIGKILRRASLDELPQLVNVLKGEMSLVGPRPVTPSELSHYGSAATAYASVRPGITGLWQVSGRNDVGYAKRVALDESYVREWNLALDLRILLRTPGVVFTRKGAR